jgi:hypothetical protein
VQKIGWILAILCAAIWLASEMPLPGDVQSPPAGEETIWRRTVEGWEKVSDWNMAIDKSPPVIHPGVFGLLMLIFPLTVGIAKNESVDNR